MASRAMAKNERPMKHDVANLPTVGNKKVEPYKQYHAKESIWHRSHVPDVNQNRKRRWPTTRRGGGSLQN